MPCHTVPLKGGGVAIVCTGRQRPKKCKGCGRPAGLACDWKVPNRKSGTCDAPICARCTTSPAPGKDLCPDHAEAFKAWLAARPPKESRNEPNQPLLDQ